MHADRFFQTTRGRIVSELRRRRSASAADLAAEFGLSPNAIRQQLVQLERDGLVLERSVRRGRTKPTYEFSLTRDAERLFPQPHERMLGAVLREVREQFGERGVDNVFKGIARRAAERVNARAQSDEPERRVAQVTEMLRESGVVAEYSLIDGGFALHEHTCPYPDLVREHPQVCSVIHQVLDDTVRGEHRQTESLADGGNECRFEIKPTPVTRGA